MKTSRQPYQACPMSWPQVPERNWSEIPPVSRYSLPIIRTYARKTLLSLAISEIFGCSAWSRCLCFRYEWRPHTSGWYRRLPPVGRIPCVRWLIPYSAAPRAWSNSSFVSYITKIENEGWMHSNCGDHRRRLPEPRVWLEAISIGVAGDSLGGVRSENGWEGAARSNHAQKEAYLWVIVGKSLRLFLKLLKPSRALWSTAW
jgi:hypothetical protein